VRFWQWNRAVHNYTHNLAVRDGDWKFVRPPVTRNKVARDSTAAPALYHLPSDPGETTDLAARHPDRLARLQAAADAWSAAVEADRTRPLP
jgi:arylsulfatase A-like enzyme